MKFDQAYCRELERLITPYWARELYFDEESTYHQQKLSFRCENENCRADLVAVNVYSEKRPKRALHFRTRQGIEHGIECPIGNYDDNSGNKKQDTKSREGSKASQFPSEFLLERPKTKNNNFRTLAEGAVCIGAGSVNAIGEVETYNKQRSVIKTSCLDHLVDCFLIYPENELKQQLLKINGKIKYFWNFFKKVRYYQDEKGLIYYGKVKNLIKYGPNYSVKFEDYAIVDGKKLSINIYIEGEVIDKYRKKKYFRTQLDRLLDSDVEIVCYFVGAYPEPVEVNREGKHWTALDVKIENLDHVTFTFN